MALRTLLCGLAVCAVAATVAMAQNQTFISGLLSNLNSQGLTNFTNIIQQIQADSNQIAFFLSLSDSSSTKTLFAPNNDAFLNPEVNFYGYTYQPDSTQFLGALLLYHLVEGTWNEKDLGTGPNHTILTTSLQGHSMSFLEADRSQVIACGSSVAGFEIYNQLTTTAVISTTTFEHVTIHTIDAIIGIPGTYSFAAGLVEMAQFLSVQQAAGAAAVANARGISVFAPVNSAFNGSDITAKLSSVSPLALYNNHILMGETVWYDTFTTGNYTSVSGHKFSFALTPNLQYAVTLNGVTANIIRSDFLINNGVIHLLDGVLYNTAAEPTSTSSSATSTSASTSSTSSSSSLSSSTSGANAATVKSSTGISGGTIAGIVVGVVGGIGLVILAVFFWRRNREGYGGQFDPPEPYTTVTQSEPFLGKSSTPMTASGVPAVSYQSTPYNPDVEAQTLASARGQKATHNPPMSAANTSESVEQQPQASHAVTQSPLPISDDVVDQILQRVAQRIDRSGPAHGGDDDAPPMYPS